MATDNNNNNNNNNNISALGALTQSLSALKVNLTYTNTN